MHESANPVTSYLIEDHSGFLEPASLVIYNAAREPLYTVMEEKGSLFRKLLRFTKLRGLAPFTVTIQDGKGDVLRLVRPGGFGELRYELYRSGGERIALFTPKKVGWKNLPLFYSPGTMEIYDRYGKLLGQRIMRNFLTVGPQEGEIIDREGKRIATFAWRRYSVTRGYEECQVVLLREDPLWHTLSLVAALLRGLSLKQR